MVKRVLCFCLSLLAAAVMLAGGKLGLRLDGSESMVGARFQVVGFRALPNDVSAFISPVYDLNGEACALVKVVASADFAFSSPLGIVKRKNETGEVWLYMPKGTKLLTIKHPQWGVMRNYRFARTLESHVTYELTIKTPSVSPILKTDTVILTKTVTDTVVVAGGRPKVPLAMHAMLTVSMHSNGPSYGVMFAMLRRHGFFLHAQSDMKSVGETSIACDRNGFLDGGAKPYYSGKTRHSNYVFTVGPVHRLCRWLDLFYGIGYGRTATAWQLAESEGGGYVLNDGYTHKGIAAEAGVLLSIGRISVSTSAVTVACKQWQACLGLGIKI